MCTSPQLLRSRQKILTDGKSPISRYNRYAPLYNIVPCGKCLECLKRLQNDWMIRMSEEIKFRGYAVFVTLTYSEEKVPWMVNTLSGESRRSLCVADVQKWIKRFRTFRMRTYGLDDKKWTYFLCGEYGPSTKRPHYHCIFFGLSKQDISVALSDWRKHYGFVQSKDVGLTDSDRTLVAKYVSKYACKGVFKGKQYGVLPEFRLMSKGLGKSFIESRSKYILCKLLFDKNLVKYDRSNSVPRYFRYTPEYLQELNRRMVYNACGNTYALPRYYKDKILTPKSNLAYAYTNFLLDERLRLRDEKLDELRRVHPGKSDGEILFMLDEQEISERIEREFKSKEQLTRFYKRSRI